MPTTTTPCLTTTAGSPCTTLPEPCTTHAAIRLYSDAAQQAATIQNSEGPKKDGNTIQAWGLPIIGFFSMLAMGAVGVRSYRRRNTREVSLYEGPAPLSTEDDIELAEESALE